MRESKKNAVVNEFNHTINEINRQMKKMDLKSSGPGRINQKRILDSLARLRVKTYEGLKKENLSISSVIAIADAIRVIDDKIKFHRVAWNREAARDRMNDAA